MNFGFNQIKAKTNKFYEKSTFCVLLNNHKVLCIISI